MLLIDCAVDATPQKLNAPGDGTLGVRILKWSTNLELGNKGDLLRQLNEKSLDWTMLRLWSSRLIVILGKTLNSSYF